MEEALSKSMQDLEDITKEVDSRDDLILEIRDQNQNQSDQIQTLILKVNYTVNEKAVVDETKEMLSYEIKKLQTEIVDLKNDVSLANKDVKILKKEKLKSEHEHVKKCEALEFKINNLQELNAEQMNDEKNLKSREKKLIKKIRAHEEDKSRFAVEKRKFECNNNAAQVTKSSQTEADVNNDNNKSITKPSLTSPHSDHFLLQLHDHHNHLPIHCVALPSTPNRLSKQAGFGF